MSESRKTQLKSALVASVFLLPAIVFRTSPLHLLIGFAVGLITQMDSSISSIDGPFTVPVHCLNQVMYCTMSLRGNRIRKIT